MKILKEVVTSVMVDDETTLDIGDHCKFIANGTCNYGIYEGIGKRGGLTFSSSVHGIPVKFSVMPKSIVSLEIL